MSPLTHVAPAHGSLNTTKKKKNRQSAPLASINGSRAKSDEVKHKPSTSYPQASTSQNAITESRDAGYFSNQDDYRKCFRSEYFTSQGEDVIRNAYSKSWPYKHSVLDRPIDDALLRAVRQEIGTKLSFTKKETDIYSLWQSGDLKNLDGLDASLVEQLPALHKLRNALYSAPFRSFLSEVTGVGPLSASKVDMAINSYTPGSHLLPHDDVIGSRKVSYILYLTDPALEWQREWGGNLRLFSTMWRKSATDGSVDMPSIDPHNTLRIGWNKLALFAVQPGKSFHDVEEVYAAGTDEKDLGRVRVAISGWYHVPQEGEEGYRVGEAEEHEAKSGRLALSKADEFDEPYAVPTLYPEYKAQKDAEVVVRLTNHPVNESILQKRKAAFTPNQSTEDSGPIDLTSDDLDFLLKYVNPRWLVPDTVQELLDEFAEQSSLRIDDFLSQRFADALKANLDTCDATLGSSAQVMKQADWKVAQPSHKQKYLYRMSSTDGMRSIQSDHLSSELHQENTVQELMCKLFPSQAFRKWLSLVTSTILRSYDIRARRFRRGVDYQLAMPYKEEEPRVEMVLCITPGGKWEDSDGEEDEHHMDVDSEGEAEDGESTDNRDKIGSEDVPKNSKKMKITKMNGEEPRKDGGKGRASKNSKDEKHSKALFSHLVEQDMQETNYGGYEVWMAGEEEDDGDDTSDQASNDAGPSSSKPAGTSKKPYLDPAIYQTAHDASGDSGVLFSMPAGWNRLSLVLRDKGTLRFVKYVSKSSGCDRWDVAGEWAVDWKKTDALEDGKEAKESDEHGGNGMDVDDVDESSQDLEAETGDQVGEEVQPKPVEVPPTNLRPSKKQKHR